ncbi:MAG: SLC13 family permease [Eubacteriales bacterium]|nr:SLC13 family permease [Eubacteriales bacterium]
MNTVFARYACGEAGCAVNHSAVEARNHIPGLERVGAWIRKNAVLAIAMVLAGISAFLVPPDAEYAGYFDGKTLGCLFGTLAVVCALKNIRFFSILARRIILLTGNARTAAVALVYITFLGSMLIANDMALITFLPLGYLVFSIAGRRQDVATVFILQNISANLGGMLTPFGNPQNLYLYAHFHIPTAEFMSIMLAPFCVSIALVTLCCLFVPARKLKISDRREEDRLPAGRTAFYLTLFAMTILMVFRILPVPMVLATVVISLMIADRKALEMVDYGLLMTFVCFFVFAGNMARLTPVRQFFSDLLQKNTLLTAVLSCQGISNVPTAILLSQFTDNYRALLLGVNIGGTGTLIASLASLITFREYTHHYPEDTRGYLLRFGAYNLGFLLVLTFLALYLCR